MNFTTPTPIQEQIIPHILEGKDCLAEAPTGTGKTFAFGIPALNLISTTYPHIQVVVLAPTRELAMQTEKELKKLSVNMPSAKILAIYGGQPIERQLAGLRKKPQIVVCTPGRMLDHIRRRTIRLDQVKMVILDEADEMLNMGFREDIDSILQELPGNANMLMFSATMPKEILEISASYQVDPVRVKTICGTSEVPDIKQYFLRVKEQNKLAALKEIMSKENYKFVLVFTNTKRRAEELDKQLQDSNYLSAALHGDLRQRVRDTVMKNYRNKSINILVATDVAARGIDVDDIQAIFNYDLPNDEEYYIHRIGRTARANKEGSAYSFATTKDAYRLKFYEKQTKTEMQEIFMDGLTEKVKVNSGKQEGTERFFVNIGVKDGLTNQQLSDFVTKNSTIKEDEITDIKMLEIFSFVEVKEGVAGQMQKLNGVRVGKRSVSVEKAGERNPAKSGDRMGHGAKNDAHQPSSLREERRFGGNKEYKPFEQRKASNESNPYVKYGDRKQDGDKKPYGDRDKKPFVTFGDKKPYGDRERKPFVSDGDKKPYGDRERKPFAADGERKPYGDRERKPFAADGERKPYGDRERKPFVSDGERKPYGDRERKPFVADHEKRTFGDSVRKPFADRDRKPTVAREDGFSSTERKSDDKPKSYKRPQENFDPNRNNGEGFKDRKFSDGKKDGRFASGNKSGASAKKPHSAAVKDGSERKYPPKASAGEGAGAAGGSFAPKRTKKRI